MENIARINHKKAKMYISNLRSAVKYLLRLGFETEDIDKVVHKAKLERYEEELKELRK